MDFYQVEYVGLFFSIFIIRLFSYFFHFLSLHFVCFDAVCSGSDESNPCSAIIGINRCYRDSQQSCCTDSALKFISWITMNRLKLEFRLWANIMKNVWRLPIAKALCIITNIRRLFVCRIQLKTKAEEKSEWNERNQRKDEEKQKCDSEHCVVKH